MVSKKRVKVQQYGFKLFDIFHCEKDPVTMIIENPVSNNGYIVLTSALALGV
jgi:hypothetical protein